MDKAKEFYNNNPEILEEEFNSFLTNFNSLEDAEKCLDTTYKNLKNQFIEQKEIQSLTITGKRWFESVNGNTYHSVKIWINENAPIYCPMQYGYDDQYLNTAFEAIQKEGFMKNKAKKDFNKLLCDKARCHLNVYDVKKKKEL